MRLLYHSKRGFPMKKTIKQALSFCLILWMLLPLLPAAAHATEDEFSPVKGTAALLVDLQYNTVLYDQNAYEKRYPASITKVMTALLVLEAVDRGELEPSTVLTASESSLADITKDSSSAKIQVGEEMTVEALLYCLLIASANDAANVLAEGVSGSISAFVDAMNTRAQELEMTGTHFSNPHGLHRDTHYTTAYDIYLMTRKAMELPLFQKIVASSQHTVPATNLSEERTYRNTNGLISSRPYAGYIYSPATGVKTGYTPEAGHCLVSSAQSNGRSLIAVVLGAEVIYATNSEDRRHFTESRRLLNHGFSDFKVQTIISPGGAMMTEVPVRLSKTVPYVVAQPNKTIEAILPSSFDPAYLNTTVTLTAESVEAPVQQGQVLGAISVTYMDIPYGQADLVAANAVPVSVPKLLWDRIWGFISSPIGLLLLAALVGYFFLQHLKGVRRKPRGGYRRPPSNITPHPGMSAAARPAGRPASKTPPPMKPAPNKPHASKQNPGKPSTGRPSQRHR